MQKVSSNRVYCNRVQKKVEMIKLRINYEVAVQCQDEGFTIEDCQMLPGGL